MVWLVCSLWIDCFVVSSPSCGACVLLRYQLVFVIRFLMNDVICHRLCQLNLLKKSANSRNLAAHLGTLCQKIGWGNSTKWLYAGRDSASVNTASINVVNSDGFQHHIAGIDTGFLGVDDIHCLAHAINTIGTGYRGVFKIAEAVCKSWSKIGKSQLIKDSFKEKTGESHRRRSNVRWFADYPVAQQVLMHWQTIKQLLTSDRNSCSKQWTGALDSRSEASSLGGV